MKYLLLSISVLWVGVHWCSGHSLSKIELKKPTELVYQIEDDTDGKSLKVSTPNLGRPTLREIVYYHLIEKPDGDAQDTTEEPSVDEVPQFDESRRTFTNGQGFQYLPPGDNNPAQAVDGDGKLDVRKDIKHGAASNSDDDEAKGFADALEEAEDQDTENATEKRRKRDIPENDKGSRETGRVTMRSRYGRYMPKPPRLSRFRPEKLPKYINNLLSASTPTPFTSASTPDSSTITPNKYVANLGYLNNDVTHDGGQQNAGFDRPDEHIDRTYGMDLKSNGGTVWNNLYKPDYSFHVGFPNGDDDSNEESRSSGSDSGSDINDSNSGSDYSSNESGIFGSSSDESPEKSAINSGEDSQSGSRQDNGDDDSTSDGSDSGSQESGNGSNSSGVGGSWSIETNSGSGENNSGSNENNSEPGISSSGSWEGNSGSGEYGSGENNRRSDEDDGRNRPSKEPVDNAVISKTFDQILTFLHDIFVKGNATIVLPFNTVDKENDFNALEMLNNIFNNIKNNAETITPGVVIEDEDTDNPDKVNVLESLFTSVIKNNIVINNNVPVNYKKPYDVGSKKDTKPTIDKPTIDQKRPPTTNLGQDNPEIADPDLEVGTKAPKGPKDGSSSHEMNETSDVTHPDEIPSNKDENNNPTPSPVEFNNNNCVNEEGNRPGETGDNKKILGETEKPFERNSEEKDNVGPKEDNTGRPTDSTPKPIEEPKVKNCPVQNKKDDDNQDGLNTKLDYMLELMNNEKFWSFMGKLGAQYLDSLTERTTKFIKEEVAAQVTKYFVDHKQVVDKEPPLNAEKDPRQPNKPKENDKDKNDVNSEEEINEPTSEENNMNEHSKDKTETTEKSKKNALKHNFSIHMNTTIMSHTVGHEKLTNIYYYCNNSNMDGIMKDIKSLVSGTNSTNIFNFVTYKSTPSPVDINEFKDTPNQTTDGNNNVKPTDLPTVTEEVTKPSQTSDGDIKTQTESGNTATGSSTESNPNKMDVTLPTGEAPVTNGDNEHSTESNLGGENNTGSPVIEEPVTNDHDVPNGGFTDTTESSTKSTSNNEDQNEPGSTDSASESNDQTEPSEGITGSDIVVTPENVGVSTDSMENLPITEAGTGSEVTEGLEKITGNDEGTTASEDIINSNIPTVTEKTGNDGSTGPSESSTETEAVTENDSTENPSVKDGSSAEKLALDNNGSSSNKPDEKKSSSEDKSTETKDAAFDKSAKKKDSSVESSVEKKGSSEEKIAKEKEAASKDSSIESSTQKKDSSVESSPEKKYSSGESSAEKNSSSVESSSEKKGSPEESSVENNNLSAKSSAEKNGSSTESSAEKNNSLAESSAEIKDSSEEKIAKEKDANNDKSAEKKDSSLEKSAENEGTLGESSAGKKSSSEVISTEKKDSSESSAEEKNASVESSAEREGSSEEKLAMENDSSNEKSAEKKAASDEKSAEKKGSSEEKDASENKSAEKKDVTNEKSAEIGNSSGDEKKDSSEEKIAKEIDASNEKSAEKKDVSKEKSSEKKDDLVAKSAEKDVSSVTEEKDNSEMD